MDEGGTRAISIYLLKFDEELGGVMLCVCKNLCTVKRDDMVRDDVDRLILEVGVVDAKIVVEPLYFVRDEVTWNESLTLGQQRRAWVVMMDGHTLADTVFSTLALWTAFSLKTGVV